MKRIIKQANKTLDTLIELASKREITYDEWIKGLENRFKTIDIILKKWKK